MMVAEAKGCSLVKSLRQCEAELKKLRGRILAPRPEQVPDSLLREYMEAVKARNALRSRIEIAEKPVEVGGGG